MNILKAKNERHEKGFSLIEVSLATIIVGIISMMVVTTMANQRKQSRALEKAEKADILRNTIAEYVKLDPSNPLDVVNYPCPADPAAPLNDPNFGVEQRNASGNCMVFGSIQQVPGTNGEPIFIGAIPTTTLGLAKSYATDSYNNRFTYAVSGQVASVNALAAGNIARGAITIKEEKGFPPAMTTVTEYSPFIIVSHGENGNGSYSEDGVLNSTGCIGDIGIL